ncbi:TatD_family deoxyribonuclease [Hexamita inflata]|uniref:TatD family deoxyribonuclease n=1 Tax=Hexamita inflata TaxID=28002 RepID=A0AA86VP64_9EUKA|nr:TatD family deoxyribonuclease [Hexamita inflata]CAI9972103.1 TatD family deoxyribonuclease [Hexamita inflata]
MDTHCHVSVLSQVTSNQLCLSSIYPQDFEIIQNSSDERIFARGFGLHPHFAHLFTDSLQSQISNLLIQTKNSFVSEIGIEMRQQYLEQNPLPLQFSVFRKLLRLAFTLNKTVQIHVVSRGTGCYPQILEELVQLKNEFGVEQLVIFHSYSGSWEQFQQIKKKYNNVLIGVSYLNFESKHVQKFVDSGVVILESDYTDGDYSEIWSKVANLQEKVKPAEEKFKNTIIQQ